MLGSINSNYTILVDPLEVTNIKTHGFGIYLMRKI